MFNNPQKRPANTAFKQQKLKAWQPILTPLPVILSFIIIGVVFVPVGYVLLDASNKVVEFEQQYDLCTPNVNGECTIRFENVVAKAPVYLYYKLENFFQNHRRYVKSRNDAQLRGEVVTSLSDLADCAPFATSSSNSTSPDSFYLPCGLIARSLFNDTFRVFNSSGQPVPLSTEGVAWKSDIDSKFNNPPKDTPGIRVIPDFEDVDFVVWMRTAALPTFRKLYRVINTDLNGTYDIVVKYNYNVSSFGGHKYVVLSTTSWLGGKNPFLGIAYMVVGAVCVLLGIIFALKHYINGRKQGDTSYLEWAN
eukprot:TRINITY_DN11284_c0_g1_i1.p1 TRINITY_DN11284_c0_g1~~TRINITY_DN11284_c0_g1_i1.p1  ORF type:complete len:307 (-),score=46.65 TRINITY_DN11284_c0_g1_i1:111-1031(-)